MGNNSVFVMSHFEIFYKKYTAIRGVILRDRVEMRTMVLYLALLSSKRTHPMKMNGDTFHTYINIDINRTDPVL